MRKASRRYRKKNNRIAMIKAILCSLLLFLALGYSTYFVQTVVQPIINDVGDMRARAMLTGLVNEVVHDVLQSEISIDHLLITQTNQDGAIEFVQANAPAINLLIADLALELRDAIGAMEPQGVRVPFGALLGSPILSQFGPSVNIEVIPLTVGMIDFRTEFVSQGINQTKYKVYIILTCQVQVLAPFSSETVDVNKKILIAEAVILGRVPESYVVVPGDKIIEGMGMFN